MSLKLGQAVLLQVGGAEMGIQDFSEDVILITLPEQSQQEGGLQPTDRISRPANKAIWARRCANIGKLGMVFSWQDKTPENKAKGNRKIAN
ncbi:MAG: hypothetical protein ACYTFW_06080 [Planctomycetota bacterium]|jgi:hypothetical protein